jgi:hypothetical protein
MLAPADSATPVIQAHFTTTPPNIDGVLEELWLTADSAYRFSQFTPDHGQPASEATTVYLLYDRKNVYVAFRCLVRDSATLCARLTGTNDGIRLFLDTFDDNASCYAFAVTAAGVEQSYRLTQDGNWVEQWNGIWWSRSRIEPWGFAVELAIPFKSLRYPPELTTWGIEFGRYVAARAEKSYWCEHDRTLVRVSRFGRIASIRTPGSGLHLEAYPVGLVRYDHDSTGILHPAAGLDAAWLPTPTANIQLTTFPDYAEIEADPYRVNLSKYELYLAERRPFFVEAAENFGSGFPAIRLFYSRRIGKRLADGTEVPIVSGIKYTDRVGRYQLGALTALTGTTSYNAGADTEPAALFSVVSLRRQVLANSELGLLYTGKDAAGPVWYHGDTLHFAGNHGLRLDGIYRRGDLTAELSAAGSQRGDSLDHALSLNTEYWSSSMNASFQVRQVRPRFDMNGTGFTSWRGQSLSAGAGPVFYARGPFQNASMTLSAGLSREWDHPGRASDRQVSLSASGQLKNRMGFSTWGTLDHAHYVDDTGTHQPYDGANVGTIGYTDESRMLYLYLYADYTTRSFNYNRGCLAPSGNLQAELTAHLGDRLALSLGSELVAEFRPDGSLDILRDATFIVRPHAEYSFTPRMTLNLGNETVRSYDPEREREEYSYYFTALYSWTLRPRSTLHVALNQRLAGGANWVETAGTVVAVKLRYLLVF